MARPKIELDISRVEELAAQGLTQAEICLCLGIGETTLYERKRESAVFEDAIKRGKAKAASEVANVLYLKAINGDLGAIIWYEKTRRGLSDRQTTEVVGAAGGPLQFVWSAAIAEIATGSDADLDPPLSDTGTVDGATVG